MTDFRMSGLIFGSDSEEEMFDKTDYIEQLNNVHKNNGFLDLSMTDLPRYDIFQTQAASFLKQMSERGGPDMKRLPLKLKSLL